jgi:hypothetical protein
MLPSLVSMYVLRQSSDLTKRGTYFAVTAFTGCHNSIGLPSGS